MKTLKEVIKEEAISVKAFEMGETYYKDKKVRNLEMAEDNRSFMELV